LIPQKSFAAEKAKISSELAIGSSTCPQYAWWTVTKVLYQIS